MPYILIVLKTFKSKALQAFFETAETRKLSVQNTARLARVLRSLQAAAKPEDMNLPGFKFHGLSGDKAGRFSVWVSGNWRVTCAWSGEDAVDIDLEDYH